MNTTSHVTPEPHSSQAPANEAIEAFGRDMIVLHECKFCSRPVPNSSLEILLNILGQRLLSLLVIYISHCLISAWLSIQDYTQCLSRRLTHPPLCTATFFRCETPHTMRCDALAIATCLGLANAFLPGSNIRRPGSKQVGQVMKRQLPSETRGVQTIVSP